MQTENDVARLLLPMSGILRNRSKVTSVIHNAQLILELQQEHGSFAAYLWGLMPGKRPLVNQWRYVQFSLNRIM